MLPTATSFDQPLPPPAKAAPRTLGKWQRLSLAFVAVELVVLFAPTVAWLYDRWTLSVWHNAHGLMIPFVVAYLAYQELKPYTGRPVVASPWGFAFLIPALTLQAVERLASVLVLPHPEREAPEVRRLKPNFETEAIAMRMVSRRSSRSVAARSRAVWFAVSMGYPVRDVDWLLSFATGRPLHQTE